MSFTKELKKYSNPTIAQRQAFKYLGRTAILHESTRQNKKYMIYNPYADSYVHFVQSLLLFLKKKVINICT